MTPARQFPRTFTIRVTPPPKGVLAVLLRFDMAHKNPFVYIAFVDAGAVVTLPAGELLHAFDKEREFFVMDYVDPRSGFTGSVTARVPSSDELRAALKAVDDYGRYFRYPEGYEEKLRAALRNAQSPDQHSVSIEIG